MFTADSGEQMLKKHPPEDSQRKQKGAPDGQVMALHPRQASLTSSN